MFSTLKSEDILVLLKLIAVEPFHKDLTFLSQELGHDPHEIINSLSRLRTSNLIEDKTHKVIIHNFKQFLFDQLHTQFPTSPGKLTQGMLTGAKPDFYFAVGLSYTSIWVWPHPDYPHKGYEIQPLSQQCCFAAANDPRLRKLLAVTETIRVSGLKARKWAETELENFLKDKES